MPDMPSSPGIEFHHLGFACKNMEQEKSRFLALGYQQEGEMFEDHHQGVRGQFLSFEASNHHAATSPRIELLEDLPGSNTLEPWLEKSAPLYHMAYLSEDIDLSIDWARKQHGKLVSKPYPAVAFNLRPVCFVLFRGNFMLEFIQK